MIAYNFISHCFSKDKLITRICHFSFLLRLTSFHFPFFSITRPIHITFFCIINTTDHIFLHLISLSKCKISPQTLRHSKPGMFSTFHLPFAVFLRVCCRKKYKVVLRTSQQYSICMRFIYSVISHLYIIQFY